ncbi:MAG: protoporphyrinogen oxidase [Acidobacteriota bacterium]|nr:protoporphyrinogen oxidase [Acidobacteriota bacterium]
MKRIVIIGGGITGLSATHRILERSHETGEQIDVTLLEAGSRIGGIVQTRERDGFLLESGPDSFIAEKPEVIRLAKRLGLESNLIETNQSHRRSFVVRQGKLLPVPEGFHLLAPGRLWPFLQSGVFSWPGKARMAMELLLPRRNINGDVATADESLAQFVRRRLGREALERMAQPMVGGIYTADPETLSLRATMPRFLEMEREHGSVIRALRKQSRSPTVKEGSEALSGTQAVSGARYSLFLSFDRGMQLLTDKLANAIANSSSGSIRLNTRVESFERQHATPNEPASWKIRTNNNETLTADAVCLALPGFVCARLLRNVDAPLASELDNIAYASSSTINLAYQREDIPHSLDGFGFVVPFVEKRSLIACTFSSVKFSGRAPHDRVLLRAFVGGALQPEMFGLDDAELISRVRSDLRDLLGIERPPLFGEVSNWELSMPQYTLGHLEKVKRIRERAASLPRLTLAGNAYSGPGIPDCIRSGETGADQLIEMLAK